MRPSPCTLRTSAFFLSTDYMPSSVLNHGLCTCTLCLECSAPGFSCARCLLGLRSWAPSFHLQRNFPELLVSVSQPQAFLYHISLYLFLSICSYAFNLLFPLLRSYAPWKLRSCLFCSSPPTMPRLVSNTERAFGECLLNEYVINNSHEAPILSVY